MNIAPSIKLLLGYYVKNIMPRQAEKTKSKYENGASRDASDFLSAKIRQ